jgi:hypothetical protein
MPRLFVIDDDPAVTSVVKRGVNAAVSDPAAVRAALAGFRCCSPEDAPRRAGRWPTLAKAEKGEHGDA